MTLRQPSLSVRFSLLVFGFMLCCSPSPLTAAEKLVGTQFMSVMNGNTLAGVNQSGDNFKAYFLPGGQVTYEDETGFKTQGPWRVAEDGSICLTLPGLWKSLDEERCVTVMLEGREMSWRGKEGSGRAKLMGTIF